MRPMVFRDRWVLVTGASSGLGRAMAMKLAREHGASIVAVARREERLEVLRRDVEAMGRSRVHPKMLEVNVASNVVFWRDL